VHLYIDDPKDATLIKTSAMIDLQHVDAQQRAIIRNERIESTFHGIGLLLVVALFVAPIMYISSCVSNYKAKLDAPKQQLSGIPDQYRVALTTHRVVRDVNNSHDIDCIDYAITYYELYGPEARLVWHKYGDFNHLFVRIPNGNGGWYNIEPTNAYMDVSKNTMEYCWGGKFNPRMVKDVTKHYEMIRNGSYPWLWNTYE
jgi:acetylornithine/succinyldiaminopimelate/putrescine aminotransferase